MKKLSTTLVTGLLLIYSTLSTAQENRIDTIRPDAPALARYGSHETGVKTLHFVHADQIDVVKAKAGEAMPHYDRPLTVEVWYPATLAADQHTGSALKAITRDGTTEVSLWGHAVRDAKADLTHGAYPLLIISHGYPGNRFLLSHLADNLASKGYVVASIDHTDSTYSDQASFASTLLNRSLDQLFVLREMARLNEDRTSGFQGMINANQTGIIGYSMGGYGVVNTIGGGLSEAAVKSPLGVPNEGLAVRQAGNAS